MDTRTGEIYDRLQVTQMEELERAEFERKVAEGRIVPVSDEVARVVRQGQRVDDRRRKRKAAKAARKKNR